ncbi:MAG: DUF1499 domain-containing protein [Chitinophagales bacterium]
MSNRYILILISVLPLLFSCSATAPEGLGVFEDKLSDCPASPNCVSTMESEDDEKHYMEPLQFDDLQEARLKVISIIMETPRTEILLQNREYIHAEYTTPILRFVDDVEFYFDTENKLLHFRSASRVGYSDFGANRRRMEKFKKAYLE